MARPWSVGIVHGAEKLDFRDVEAFGESTAYLLSAGPGEDSRIYKTTDGGKTWALQFTNSEPAAFFNAIAFWDDKSGIALSDPVKGRFLLIVTDDGGKNWKRLAENPSWPSALPNEGRLHGCQRHLPRHLRQEGCLVLHGRSQNGEGLSFGRSGAELDRKRNSDRCRYRVCRHFFNRLSRSGSWSDRRRRLS